MKTIEKLVKKIKEVYGDYLDDWSDDKEKERRRDIRKREKENLKEAKRIVKICLKRAKIGSGYEWFVMNDEVSKILRKAGLVVTDETGIHGASKRISWPVG
jgi:hypothetical protein